MVARLILEKDLTKKDTEWVCGVCPPSTVEGFSFHRAGSGRKRNDLDEEVMCPAVPGKWTLLVGDLCVLINNVVQNAATR